MTTTDDIEDTPRTVYELVDWGGWRYYPATRLLEVRRPPVTLRLGSHYDVDIDCLGDVLRRADRLFGRLTDEERQGLWQILEDIFDKDVLPPVEVQVRLDRAQTREIENLVDVLNTHQVADDLDIDHPHAVGALTASGWPLSVAAENQFDEAQRYRRRRVTP